MNRMVPRMSVTAPIEEVIAGLRECGAVIVENVLNADLLQRFNAELDRYLNRQAPNGAT